MLHKIFAVHKMFKFNRNYFQFSIIDGPENNQGQINSYRNTFKENSYGDRKNVRQRQEKSRKLQNRREYYDDERDNKNQIFKSRSNNSQAQVREKQNIIKKNRWRNESQYSESAQRNEEGRQSDRLFNEQDLKSIDTVNKYFQGLRINTKYVKCFNQDKFQSIKTYTKSKIGDLPFSLKPTFQNSNDSAKISSVARNILKKINRKNLQKKLKQMSYSYFSDLINEERKVKIEPNFQRQGRRAIASLKNAGYKFASVPKQKFSLIIQQVVLYKGLQVIRNNNYSIDSYQVINHHQYKQYKLWERGAYKIPEQQWTTKKNMIMQIRALVECPHQINLINPSENNKQVGIEGEKKYHQITFEINLRHPPKFAEFRLSTEQLLKKYEVNEDQIYITNVDNKNPYFAFVYEQNEKKQKLINKLV